MTVMQLLCVLNGEVFHSQTQSVHTTQHLVRLALLFIENRVYIWLVGDWYLLIRELMPFCCEV